MIKFTIYGKLPNLNEYTEACRNHYHAGGKMKRYAQEQCEWAIMNQCKGKSMESCDVYITWYEENQKRDPDNVVFAKKFIFDALVKTKVLKNDGWKQIRSMTDILKVDKLNPRIEVELHEPSG